MRTFLTHDLSPFGDRTQRRVGGRTVSTKSGWHDTPSLANSWAGVLWRGILILLGVGALAGVASAADAGTTGQSPAGLSGASPGGAVDADFTGMNLEDLMKMEVPVVYSASKPEQKITEAPSAVTIVTADEIKKGGYRTLNDILNNGFYVTYDRIYSYIGVRGVNRSGDYGGRILIAVDGGTNTTVIVGCLADDPAEPILARSLESKPRRPIKLMLFKERDDPSDCHLLFISRARRAQVDDMLARLEKATVLTVSEIDQFAHRGGMINFIRHERTFRFEINVEAAERAGLRISSRLVSMATVVKTTPAP